MKDYHDLRLKDDVLLLACVFETSRDESINYFQLDPTYYLSAAGYSKDEMLRFPDVNLKLISDIGQYQFVESTVRGGVSMIFKGYAKVYNNLFKSYDAKKAA